MKDMYKLENEIHNVWAIKDLLRTFMWRYLDHPSPMSEDDVANTIMGIEYIFDMQMEKLFDVYKQVAKLDEYAPAEVKKHREKVLQKIFDKTEGKKGKEK
jgi:hypothetical protein